MGTVGVPATGPMRSDARRNRERLLAAALTEFTECGADDTSLEAIARRAGVGIGTLYRHFPTRQALLESVYRDQVNALCARAGQLRDAPGPAAALITWLQALIAFSLTKRTLMSGLLATPGAMEGPVFSACRTEILEAASQLLTRAQEVGEVRADIDATDLLRITHAVVAATERAADREREADRLLNIMLGGVLRPAASPASPEPA